MVNKKKISKILKLNSSKRSSRSYRNLLFFKNTKYIIKRIKKHNQLDYCKIKILENQREIDILTKDSVLNMGREH